MWSLVCCDEMKQRGTIFKKRKMQKYLCVCGSLLAGAQCVTCTRRRSVRVEMCPDARDCSLLERWTRCRRAHSGARWAVQRGGWGTRVGQDSDRPASRPAHALPVHLPRPTDQRRTTRLHITRHRSATGEVSSTGAAAKAITLTPSAQASRSARAKSGGKMGITALPMVLVSPRAPRRPA